MAATAPADPSTHEAALAALLGVTPGAIPDPVVARVVMIHEARRRGVTWARIAPTIGCDGPKAAKAAAKRLAKAANARLVAEAARNLETA